jgi:dephospho-CoA kinase
MLRIGITGGIGSGKSIVSRLFQVLGVPIYDADTRARWVMENDDLLRQQLHEAFGHDIYDADNRLNRPFLARLVFSQPELLARLNALVHPRVGADFESWVTAQQAAGHAYVLKEAALMFESNSYRQLDQVITVTAPLVLRQARVLRRDPHRTADDVLAIMDKQLSEEEKVARAQHVIINDDAHLLIPQVLNLHQQFGQIGN